MIPDFGMFLQTRIPVTVLTGVLGAGKTTLLKCHSQAFNGLQNGTWCWKLLGRHWSLPRHILENPHGYRIAVIQNEPAPQNGWLESCVESLALLEHLRFSEEMGMEALPYPAVPVKRQEITIHRSDTLRRRLCLLTQRELPSRTELFLACAKRLMDVCLEGRRLVGYVVGDATAHSQCSWTIWLDLLCWEPRPVQDVYELPNGCLCCSAKAVQTGGSQLSLHDQPVTWEWCQDGLIGMLDVLLEQKDRFDYVLVEADGQSWSLPHCDNDGLRTSQWMEQCRRPGSLIQKLFVRCGLHHPHISTALCRLDPELEDKGFTHAIILCTAGFLGRRGAWKLDAEEWMPLVFHQQVMKN